MIEFAIDKTPPTAIEIETQKDIYSDEKNKLKNINIALWFSISVAIITSILYLCFNGVIDFNNPDTKDMSEGLVFAAITIIPFTFMFYLFFNHYSWFIGVVGIIIGAFILYDKTSEPICVFVFPSCFAVAISAFLSSYLNWYLEKQLSLDNNLFSLSKTNKSNFPRILEYAQRRSEIKSYVQAVAAQEPRRELIEGEYNMLFKFDSDYDANLQKEQDAIETEHAYELICSGRI